MESETQQQFSLLCNFIVEFTFVSLLQQHCVYLSLSKGPKKKKKRTSKSRQQMDFSELGKHNHCSTSLKKSSLQRSVNDGEENGNPLQESCLGNHMDREAPNGLQLTES